MLVLTRRVGEVLCIGNDITLKITGVHGNQVKIAIAAPADVRIDRQELRDKIAVQGKKVALHE